MPTLVQFSSVQFVSVQYGLHQVHRQATIIQQTKQKYSHGDVKKQFQY